mgnify:CR=1 FL=1
MTVTELIDILIPILVFILLTILIGLSIIATGLVLRVKKIIERLEAISDVSGWINILRKWPKKNKQSST